MGDLRATLWPVLIVLGATGVLLMLQPDLGTAIVTAAIVVGMLYIAGTPLLPLATATATLGGAALFLTMSVPYRRARLLSFLHPSDDPLNRGWQTLQSLVGIASGGLAGVGLGAGRAKWGFLPEAHTDFIFAIIGEELGFVGCFVVVGLFAAFGVLGLQTARRAPDRYGMLVAAGVTVWVLVQSLVNMGAVVGLLPITGLPLPFVSFGGSALITTMAATGLLLNIAWQGTISRSPSRSTPSRSTPSRSTPSAISLKPINTAMTASADAFAVIAGGGTAGHVNPGLAVAAALVERGHPPSSITWVGSERGLEATMVPAAGHPLHLLPGRGVQRRVTLANVAALWGIVVATLRGGRHRSPPPARRRGGARRVRQRSLRVRGVGLASADRGHGAERAARTREPPGRPCREGGSSVLRRHRASACRCDREPTPPRGRRCAT